MFEINIAKWTDFLRHIVHFFSFFCTFFSCQNTRYKGSREWVRCKLLANTNSVRKALESVQRSPMLWLFCDFIFVKVDTCRLWDSWVLQALKWTSFCQSFVQSLQHVMKAVLKHVLQGVAWWCFTKCKLLDSECYAVMWASRAVPAAAAVAVHHSPLLIIV